MGCRACKDGVTLEFKLKDGTPDPNHAPVFGKYAIFYSRQRPVSPGDPDPLLGSQDWLTDVLVTDDPGKLAQLTVTQNQEAETSCSSKQVRVQWWVGDDKGYREESVTIATCPDPVNNRFIVKEIKVHPADADIAGALRDPWTRGAQRLI